MWQKSVIIFSSWTRRKTYGMIRIIDERIHGIDRRPQKVLDKTGLSAKHCKLEWVLSLLDNEYFAVFQLKETNMDVGIVNR